MKVFGRFSTREALSTTPRNGRAPQLRSVYADSSTLFRFGRRVIAGGRQQKCESGMKRKRRILNESGEMERTGNEWILGAFKIG